MNQLWVSRTHAPIFRWRFDDAVCGDFQWSFSKISKLRATEEREKNVSEREQETGWPLVAVTFNLHRSLQFANDADNSMRLIFKFYKMRKCHQFIDRREIYFFPREFICFHFEVIKINRNFWLKIILMPLKFYMNLRYETKIILIYFRRIKKIQECKQIIFLRFNY